MKYRKKPIVIEAVQHFADMGTRTAEIPFWLIEACQSGVVFAQDDETFIKTLEGDMRVSYGDWILQGIDGELYPCKPDIFEKSYEPVVDPFPAMEPPTQEEIEALRRGEKVPGLVLAKQIIE